MSVCRKRIFVIVLKTWNTGLDALYGDYLLSADNIFFNHYLKAWNIGEKKVVD